MEIVILKKESHESWIDYASILEWANSINLRFSVEIDGEKVDEKGNFMVISDQHMNFVQAYRYLTLIQKEMPKYINNQENEYIKTISYSNDEKTEKSHIELFNEESFHYIELKKQPLS